MSLEGKNKRERKPTERIKFEQNYIQGSIEKAHQIKVPRGKPRGILRSELYSLFPRGKPRGIEPVLRLRSDEMRQALASTPR